MIFEAGIELFGALLYGIPLTAELIIKALPDIFNAIIEAFNAFISNLGNVEDKMEEVVKPWITKFVDNAKNCAKNVVDGFINFFKTLPEKVGYWIGQVAGKIARFIVDLPEKAKNGAVNFVNSFINDSLSMYHRILSYSILLRYINIIF